MLFSRPKSHKIAIILRNQMTINVTCESWKCEYDQKTGECTMWAVEGVTSQYNPKFIQPSEIVALLVRR